MRAAAPALFSALLMMLAPLARPAEDAETFFENRVRPLLAGKCGACHGERQPASGLTLTSREGLLRGGKRGPALQPGDAGASLLARVVEHNEGGLKMPPSGKLAAAEIASIRTWIESGAAWPERRAAAKSAAAGRFWSFEPLRAMSGSIDFHARAAMRTKRLTPNGRASDRVLLRRLTFALTGLPPGEEQSQQFLASRDPRKLEKLVDELLASPAFGERWGRHWLDVVRYGEDDFSGTERKPYANAWRYRDWVIAAFNRDLPYDRFVIAQIAADLTENSAADLAALGLFGLGPWYFGISQPPQARADERHDRVDLVSRGLLGLTAACARCHDHKYDPIPQRDYYALAGVFASSKYKIYPLAGEAEVKAYDAAQERIQTLEKGWKRFLDTQREQLAEIYARQAADFLLEKQGLDEEVAKRWKDYLAKPEEDHSFLKPFQKAASPAEKAAAAAEFQRILLETMEAKKALDEENRQTVIRASDPNVKRRKEILPGNYDSEADFNPGAEVAVKSLDRERFQLYQKMVGGGSAVCRLDDAGVTKRLSGEWKAHLDRLKAEWEDAKKASPPPYPYLNGIAEHEEPVDLPVNVRGNPWQLGEPAPRQFLACLSDGGTVPLRSGSGRLELARAIVAHPLAARVMANRIWTWLFGAGLVRTPSNFGAMGERPANPELLEYLAWRFRAVGFSMKKLIREIVLSETYLASSDADAANTKLDPDNRYFWRANRRRLDAEAIRDSLLAVSGELDGQKGGESAPFNDDNPRRSVYLEIGRYQQNQTLALFDFPSASVHAEQRTATNVPLQKLFFLNSGFIEKRSAALAKRADGSVERAYGLLFQRAPSARERALAQTLAAREGWPALAQVLLSTNEFLYLD